MMMLLLLKVLVLLKALMLFLVMASIMHMLTK
jgi:hypothetical protein